MAVLAAITAVLLHRYLVAIGLGRVAMPATLAAALGSDLWTIASQAAWQHGPAAFCLMTAILLLRPSPTPRWRLFFAGIATAFLFSCRLIDGLFAAVILLWVARYQTKGLLWFLPAPIIGGLMLLHYNLWFFGDLTGGQAHLERIHRNLHQLPGAWSGNVIEGAVGTLFSPSRGLFVFTPWVLVVIATSPFFVRKLASHRLVFWLLLALAPYLLLFSKYAVWWGGHCFGPRYWTDVMPLLAIPLAFGLDWAVTRSHAAVALFAVSIVAAIGIQVIGAFCYPSTWNQKPVNVDYYHERLWDWRDTELSRCVRETLGSWEK
jgi:hypothetical protein